MKRRELLAGLLPVAVAPPAWAQQPGKMHRIAVFHPSNPVSDISEQGTAGYRVLFKELRRLGYEEGRNLTVERYSGGGQGLQSDRQLASQIVATRPDLIFPMDFIPAFVEAAAGKVPIFVWTAFDPIELGLTTSLARPSGNVTGIVGDTGGLALSHKRFEVIRDLRPGLKHVAVLYPDRSWRFAHQTFFRGLEEQWGIRTTCLCAATPVGEAAYRQAFRDVERERPDVIWVGGTPENFTYADLIVGLVNAARIPAVYSDRSFVERGGLISFGVDFDEMFRHLAHQMDMILRGRPVAEVPFYRLTTAELAINLRTAEMLGIEIPPLLLARATKVIE